MDTQSLESLGYKVEPISGTDHLGDTWTYKVTGKRGAVWYILHHIHNCPVPFFKAYKGQDVESVRYGVSAIGKFESFAIIDDKLHGIIKAKMAS